MAGENVIKDIPTEIEFEKNGLLFLNLAWDIVSDLYFEARTLGEWDLEFDESEEDKTLENMVWAKSSHFLSNSLVLIQQGLEFLLKARIAGVSPYLLLSSSPKNWPKKSDINDTSFASFRTVDAHDLARTVNTFTRNPLSDNFKNLIDTIRLSRNSVIHSLGQNVSLKPDVMWKWILEILSNLSSSKWNEFRKTYLSERTEALVNMDFVEGKMVSEGLQLLSILKSTERKKYLGVSGARLYICKNCTDYHNEYTHSCSTAKSAQLYPNSPASTKLKCYICHSSISVVRCDCLSKECKGNVIDIEYSVCLTCGKYHDLDF